MKAGVAILASLLFEEASGQLNPREVAPISSDQAVWVNGWHRNWGKFKILEFSVLITNHSVTISML
jgi:hypothetical protein